MGDKLAVCGRFQGHKNLSWMRPVVLAVEGAPTTMAPVDWSSVCPLGLLDEEMVNERVTREGLSLPQNHSLASVRRG